jgi:hypothetical protein
MRNIFSISKYTNMAAALARTKVWFPLTVGRGRLDAHSVCAIDPVALHNVQTTAILGSLVEAPSLS